jgi:hypothetical protein
MVEIDKTRDAILIIAPEQFYEKMLEKIYLLFRIGVNAAKTFEHNILTLRIIIMPNTTFSEYSFSHVLCKPIGNRLQSKWCH